MHTKFIIINNKIAKPHIDRFLNSNFTIKLGWYIIIVNKNITEITPVYTINRTMAMNSAPSNRIYNANKLITIINKKIVFTGFFWFTITTILVRINAEQIAIHRASVFIKWISIVIISII